jgi:hypothetical protein
VQQVLEVVCQALAALAAQDAAAAVLISTGCDASDMAAAVLEHAHATAYDSSAAAAAAAVDWACMDAVVSLAAAQQQQQQQHADQPLLRQEVLMSMVAAALQALSRRQGRMQLCVLHCLARGWAAVSCSEVAQVRCLAWWAGGRRC